MHARVAILIVSFRNADNVADCLRALARTAFAPGFEIFIAENGGTEAMNQLVRTIAGSEGPCVAATEPSAAVGPLCAARQALFQIESVDGTLRKHVHVAEMAENLGYAGGINAWLRPLLNVAGWEAVWILNPDTEPSSTALEELRAYAERHHKGMIGSCLVPTEYSDDIQIRGLAWHRLAGTTIGVDHGSPRFPVPAAEDIEARLDSPSGASMYVLRALIEEIGLMDDSYFLYYEDLEWGFRAKALGAIGYAHRAVVPHKGGTTITTATNRAARSPLGVYLEFRNRILFVRRQLPHWTAWTVFVQIFHIGRFATAGARGNTVAACRGVLAGVRGETGRPEHYMLEHRC
jgi:N-acetylglucosaminyl-diphospho-decaprenol L-rhamnosyltransferase